MTTQTIDYTTAINPIIDGFKREQLEKIDLQVRAMETLMERLIRSGSINIETTRKNDGIFKNIH